MIKKVFGGLPGDQGCRAALTLLSGASRSDNESSVGALWSLPSQIGATVKAEVEAQGDRAAALCVIEQTKRRLEDQ